MFGRAKKSLGQNFLTSEGALLSMCNAASVTKGDTILEIGPGRGALTKKLLETGAAVYAIEKDADLIAPLTQLFISEITSGQLRIIEGDALTVDTPTQPYKLVANIPYYITGALLERFLSAKQQPTSITVLVQKEVAERIVARDNKESILSISVKAYGVPTFVQTVKRGSFNPAPNVDSAILHIADVSKELFTKHNVTEARFFEVVRAGFAHKRKHIGSNVSSLVSTEQLTACGVTKESRAETLSVEQWFCLSETK